MFVFIFLFFLKPVALELQGIAVLVHGADAVVGDAVGDFDIDFEGDFCCSAGEAGEVTDDFFSDAAGITPDAGAIEGDCAVIAFRLRRLRWSWKGRLNTRSRLRSRYF